MTSVGACVKCGQDTPAEYTYYSAVKLDTHVTGSKTVATTHGLAEQSTLVTRYSDIQRHSAHYCEKCQRKWVVYWLLIAVVVLVEPAFMILAGATQLGDLLPPAPEWLFTALGVAFLPCVLLAAYFIWTKVIGGARDLKNGVLGPERVVARLAKNYPGKELLTPLRYSRLK